MKDIEEASDKYLIYSAFNAINKIYALEDSVDYSKDNYLEQLNSVREKAREPVSFWRMQILSWKRCLSVTWFRTRIIPVWLVKREISTPEHVYTGISSDLL